MTAYINFVVTRQWRHSRDELYQAFHYLNQKKAWEWGYGQGTWWLYWCLEAYAIERKKCP